MEIRNSTPDVYRELQLPQGKKRAGCSLPARLLLWDTPLLLLTWGETPGSAGGVPAPIPVWGSMARKTDSPESGKTHSNNYFMGLFFSDAPSFRLKNLRVLEESKFPAAPLGGEEMLSLLLKDRGVKWAAPSGSFPFQAPALITDLRNRTAPHSRRQRGKQAGLQSRRTEGTGRSAELQELGLVAGMLLQAGRKLPGKSFQWHFLESCRKASQVEGRARTARAEARAPAACGDTATWDGCARWDGPSQDPASSSPSQRDIQQRDTRVAAEYFCHPKQVVTAGTSRL